MNQVTLVNEAVMREGRESLAQDDRNVRVEPCRLVPAQALLSNLQVFSIRLLSLRDLPNNSDVCIDQCEKSSNARECWRVSRDLLGAEEAHSGSVRMLQQLLDPRSHHQYEE